MYYLNSVTEVKQEIERRKRDQKTIQSMLNQHIEDVFGIQKYTELISSGIVSSITNTESKLDPETSYGILARQVPGLCVEDLACYMLSVRLGLKPLSLAFTRDTFHSGSNDKLFRVKIPISRWSKKGNLTVTFNPVVTNTDCRSFTELDMIRLDKLMVNEITLPEYHRSMQQEVFAKFEIPYLWGDISSTWGEILSKARLAGKHPVTVWRSNEKNRDIQWDGGYSSDDALSLLVRPLSKWYYHLYLSMFLDGQFVLLETYDNENGGVPEARRLFEKEMDGIYRAIGYMPLVVKTYPLRHDMLYVNQHIIDDPFKASYELPAKKYWTDDTVSMTRWFADQVIQFGRSC